MIGHLDHRAEGSVAAYADECQQAIVDHWAAKVLARPTDEEKRAQVEATPQIIQPAVRERARELYRQQRQG